MPDIPPFPKDRQELSRALEQLGAPRLPGLLGIELLEITEGASSMRMEIGERHLASNGYLHAASVVALADTTAGYGCVANLPDGAIGFTTIELKSNHLGTQLDGALLVRGVPGPRRANHPGLGCRGHRRGDSEEDRSVPLHPDDPVSPLT